MVGGIKQNRGRTQALNIHREGELLARLKGTEPRRILDFLATLRPETRRAIMIKLGKAKRAEIEEGRTGWVNTLDRRRLINFFTGNITNYAEGKTAIQALLRLRSKKRNAVLMALSPEQRAHIFDEISRPENLSLLYTLNAELRKRYAAAHPREARAHFSNYSDMLRNELERGINEKRLSLFMRLHSEDKERILTSLRPKTLVSFYNELDQQRRQYLIWAISASGMVDLLGKMTKEQRKEIFTKKLADWRRDEVLKLLSPGVRKRYLEEVGDKARGR